MGLSRSRGEPRMGRRRAVVVAATVAPALAACNGTTAPPVSLPSRAVSATPAASSPRAALSAQQQVIAARTSYTVAVGEAERSGSATEARKLLGPYLAADRIDDLVQTMTTIWAKGEVFYGQDILHILRVTVAGTTAFVYDCDDTSSMGLKYAVTGEVVPGSEGSPEMNLVTRLNLSGGHWLVQFQVVEDEPCTA
jgi:hypothetical protein